MNVLIERYEEGKACFFFCEQVFQNEKYTADLFYIKQYSFYKTNISWFFTVLAAMMAFPNPNLYPDPPVQSNPDPQYCLQFKM